MGGGGGGDVEVSSWSAHNLHFKLKFCFDRTHLLLTLYFELIIARPFN